MLIKAKQLDITTVAVSLTNLFNSPSGETSRNNFVNSIKNAPGFDEKVKAGSNINDIPGYLIDKIVGDTSDPAMQINTSYDTVNFRLILSSTVNPGAFVPLILSAMIVLQFTAIELTPIYDNPALIDKRILYLAREGVVLSEGAGVDEYTFDNVAGEITFNSPLVIDERVRILYI